MGVGVGEVHYVGLGLQECPNGGGEVAPVCWYLGGGPADVAAQDALKILGMRS